MIDERFVYLGVLLSLIGGLKYVIDTLKGKAKPNRVTWLLWSVAPLLAFSAEIQKGVGIQSLMTLIVGVNPLLVFFASFINKHSYWKLNKIDYFYGALALAGIIAWKITGDGNIAIIFSILADGFASLPTVIKSFKNPETESSAIYIFSGINAIITLLTIKSWTFAHWGFPAYFVIICTILVLLIHFKLGRVIIKHQTKM